MLSHCRPPPTVGEFFAGHPHWQTLWSLDSTAETVTVTNRQRREKKIPEKFRCTLSERGERALGLRTASGSTLGGARTQVRARTTRERGRAGAWASGCAASRVRIRQRPLQGQLERATRYARSAGPARMGQRGCRWCDQHTHTYTHIQAQAFVGLDRLFVDF